MKKIFLIGILTVLLLMLCGCRYYVVTKRPIREGIYVGDIVQSITRIPDYEEDEEDEENSEEINVENNDDVFPYQGATTKMVVTSISKEEYKAANGINVLKDQSRIRRSNYYRFEFSIIFDDERETIFLPITFIGPELLTSSARYIHRDGYMSVKDRYIYFTFGDKYLCGLDKV